MSMYWDEVEKLYARQRVKGLKQYGQYLEDNFELTDPSKIITEAEEELVDALMYLEHAKRHIRECGCCDESSNEEAAALEEALKNCSIMTLESVDPQVEYLSTEVIMTVIKEMVPVIITSSAEMVATIISTMKKEHNE